MSKDEIIFKWTEILSSALEQIDEDKFDVILFSLSDNSGIDTFRKIKSLSQIPVIILSGLNDESIAIKAINEGAKDYFLKENVDYKLLFNSIEYSINRKSTSEIYKRTTEKEAMLELIKRRYIGQNLSIKLFRAEEKSSRIVSIEKEGVSVQPMKKTN